MTPLYVATLAGRIGRSAAFRKPAPVSLPQVTMAPAMDEPTSEPARLPAKPTFEDAIRAAVAAHMKTAAVPVTTRNGRIVPSVDLIMRETALAYGVPQYLIKAHDTRPEPTLVRQVFYTIARHMTGQGVAEIGRRCGGRDHTTILHGIRKIETRMATDADLAAQIAIIKSRVNAVAQRSIVRSNGDTNADRAE